MSRPDAPAPAYAPAPAPVLHPLRGRRVFVAGHRGMVGAALVRRLAAEDCEVLTVPRATLDLRDQAATRAWFRRERPDAVFLAAARVGGIEANRTRPADFLHDNLAIQTNAIAAAAEADVGKLLFLGSSCIYPREAPQPIREAALLTGPLEPTNRAYAIAKIAGLELCAAWRAQHGADFVAAMPTNLYGPGDNWDLGASHVLAALLRKAHEARRTGGPLEVWGSGTPLREFLHVDDLADALVFVMERWSDAAPINVGSGEEVSIADLARLAAATVGFRGEIRFDPSRPDGTPRKLLDRSRLTALGWDGARPLAEGMRQTYAWFLAAEGALRGAA